MLLLFLFQHIRTIQFHESTPYTFLTYIKLSTYGISNYLLFGLLKEQKVREMILKNPTLAKESIHELESKEVDFDRWWD